MELLNVLQELIPCIKGKWFLSDGALLGIIREGGLISFDHDIDIYILEDTTIDLTDSLKLQKYYICDKIYSPLNPKDNKNTWLEYCAHIKTFNRKLNRPQIFKLAGQDYHEKRIVPKFTVNHIDIFTLKKSEDGKYRTKWPDYYYNESELELVKDSTLGFDIWVPSNAEAVLERIYGDDWRIPNEYFKYY